MADDETAREPQGAPGSEEAADAPDEEELRRRIDEGLRKVRVQDVLLESVVTVINLTARRIGKPDERDLGQARVGIDAVGSLVDLLEPEPAQQVRNALAELQMLYAREAGGGGSDEPPEDGGGEPGAGGEPPPQSPQEPRGGAPAGGLWTPPGA
jgi:hypothetical protein